ncbi:uncharacterized protein METZ01_LOCUS435161 [marine metagenome]|uniref:Uncharacterized protein n=1 Tax=marine metagenome TaxID=408172 RepID=A0A382YG67_9ZZZZ
MLIVEVTIANYFVHTSNNLTQFIIIH